MKGKALCRCDDLLAPLHLRKRQADVPIQRVHAVADLVRFFHDEVVRLDRMRRRLRDPG